MTVHADAVADRAERVSRPTPTISRIAIVPSHLGPLRDLSDEARGNDVDKAMDELFGETTDERPGPFDLFLLASGVGLIGWAVAMNASGPALPLGVIALVLGLALPARSLVRAGRARRRARTQRRALRDGYPLDIGHEATAALARAHTRLIEIAGTDPGRVETGALEAAHLAVVEVATLLDGAPPVAPAEIAYVAARTQAIRDTTSQLVRIQRIRSRLAATDEEETFEARARRAAALTQAREELSGAFGMGSIDQLEAVQDLLRRERAGG